MILAAISVLLAASITVFHQDCDGESALLSRSGTELFADDGADAPRGPVKTAPVLDSERRSGVFLRFPFGREGSDQLVLPLAFGELHCGRCDA
jgi:hypothetical protein